MKRRCRELLATTVLHSPKAFRPVLRRTEWLWQPGGFGHRRQEEIYAAAEDPRGYRSSAYEQRKFAALLASLDAERFSSALEVGCAEGAFTEMLAPRCDELLGVDISETAIARAAERLATDPHVRVECRVLPLEMPDGPFDLIVCADVLCFWIPAVVEAAVAQFVDELVTGGKLALLHYTGFAPGSDARFVHRTALEHERLQLVRSDPLASGGPNGAGYLLDVLRKR